MDRGACWVAVHRITKSRTRLKPLSMRVYCLCNRCLPFENGSSLRDTVFCLLLYTWYVLFCCLVTKSCPTLCDLMGCSPPGASVHGISQAEILEWVAISFSRGSSQPREPVYPASPALQADSLPLSRQGRAPQGNNSLWHQPIPVGMEK